MRRRRIGVGSFVVFCFWAFAGAAWSAQQPAATESLLAAEPPVKTPKPIAITEIIPSSDLALIRLRNFRNALESDTSVNAVASAVPAFTEQSDEWWETEGTAIQKLHSVQRINDLTWQLHLYDAQIATWSGLLTSSSKRWSAEREALLRLTADWKATQSALDKTAPDAVATKVREVLREGESVQNLFERKIGQLVAVQDKLADRLIKLDEIRLEIETARELSVANLLELSAPPMWKAFSGNPQAPSAAQQVREAANKLYRDAASFYELYGNRLLFHLALTAILLVLFFRLRRITRIPGELSPTDTERFVLDRCFTSAVLVALLSVPLLYSDASPQMMRILLLPAVIPMLLLLPAVFSTQLRYAYYVLLAVYFLELWRYYLPPQFGAVRILLMGEALLCIGLAYLTYKAKVTGPAAESSRKSLIRSVLRTGLGVFILAIVANLIGAFTLAEFLISPVVRTLYMGVAIHMFTFVMTTFAIVALHSQFVRWSRTVQQRRAVVAGQIRKLARITTACLWIVVGIFNIGALGVVQHALGVIFGAQWKLGAAEISVQDIIIFGLVFGTAYILSRMLRFILAQEIFPRFHMPRGVPDALELLARYGVLLFGFLLALISAGVNLSQLTLALSALGVGIGFGLQNIVNNFVCGLILVFEHPIQVGDFVEVGPHFGKVQRIGFRSSSLDTLDGGNVIIPNSELIGTRVMNWSLSDQLRRVTLRLPVPAATDPKRIIDMLQSSARNLTDVVSFPAPSAALEDLGDGTMKFILRCWTQTEKYESVGFKLTLAINSAFQQAGIQIPNAQSDVYLHWRERTETETPTLEKLNPMTAGGSPPKTTAGS